MDNRVTIAGRRLLPRAATFSLVLVVSGSLLFPLLSWASGPASPKAVADFEVDFMKETVDHHFSAVKMGELCVRKTTLPSVREVCKDIVEAQRREISELRTWLRNWYGTDEQPSLDAQGRQMLEMLRSTSGRDFDIAISQAFIEHHGMMLPMASSCMATAEHDALENLCEEMFEAQLVEIRFFGEIIDRLS
jgi:uncharacterized protein (DUF305 family)